MAFEPGRRRRGICCNPGRNVHLPPQRWLLCPVAATEFHRGHWTQKPALRWEVDITAWIAAYATASTAGLKRHLGGGCTHVQRISRSEERRVGKEGRSRWS